MPNQVLWFERGLQCLRATRLAEPEKPAVLLLVNGFVRNEATLEADLMQAAQASGVALEHAGAAYGRLLGRLADPERFPAIHAVLAARASIRPGTTADDVQFGLDRILDGSRYCRARRPQGRQRRKPPSPRRRARSRRPKHCGVAKSPRLQSSPSQRRRRAAPDEVSIDGAHGANSSRVVGAHRHEARRHRRRERHRRRDDDGHVLAAHAAR